MDDDGLSWCDACGKPCARGWMFTTGLKDEETKLPIVEICCNACYESGWRPGG